MTLAKTPRQTRRHASAVDELASPLRPFFGLSLETKIALGVLAILCVWALAILTFGVPALVWPMKIIVPTMVVALVLLTLGLL